MNVISSLEGCTKRRRIMAEDDRTVLSFGDSLLTKSDLDLLSGPYWINDKIIAFCFEYFEREQFSHSADRLSLLCPSMTQLIRFASAQDLTVLLESLHLPSKEYVFVPINDHSDDSAGGTHWSLMVYIRSRQEFQHLDPMKGSNEGVARKLMNKLQPFVQAPRGKLKFVEMDCPRQQNGYDCGMYVLAMAEHLIKELCECFSIGVSEVVNQVSVQRKRTQLHDLILQVAAAEEERDSCEGGEQSSS